jgi:hypothetical protein
MGFEKLGNLISIADYMTSDWSRNPLVDRAAKASHCHYFTVSQLDSPRIPQGDTDLLTIHIFGVTVAIMAWPYP